jgi:cell division inhibitor SepF
MSTLHKVKAYFGMAPMDDYDDEYYYDDDRGRSYPRSYGPRRYEDRREFDDRRDYDDREADDYGYRAGYDEPRFESRMRPPRERFSLRGATSGALAMDPRRMARLFDESSPLSKITTLRPKDYSDARSIGERFRGGTPVIMDLVSMDNADAKRLVDFAAGLAFALRGSFDKVATKVFLLSPADVDVSAEERRRIAEAGFYAYQ